MRFAYINSQGKEVGIPSVEALQLRIELGAIVESTMFFDANADRWAPAADHDIFRTLQREIGNKEGGDFVAPPPPTLETPPAPEAASPAEPEPAPPRESPAEPPLAEETSEPAPSAEEPAVAEEADLGLGSLTLLSDDDASAGDDRAAVDTGRDLAGEFSDLGFELTALKDEGGKEEEEESPSEAPASSGPFDFGDFGALEVEKTAAAEDEGPPPAVGAVELESPLGAQDFGSGGQVEESLDLETPMSEYTADAPPAWMDERELEPAGGAGRPAPERGGDRSERRAAAGAGSAAASRTGGSGTGEAPPAGGGGAASESAGARREPRARPARVARQETKGPAGAIIAVILLLLVVGGGWFGWSTFRGRSGPVEEQVGRTYAPVEIPALPPQLETTFRSLADAALNDWVERLRALPPLGSVPEQPPAEWLAGIYLANASQYASVAEYWNALGDWLTSAREGEERVFRESVQARLDSAGVSGADREALEARAVAGFQAALPERDPSYDALAALIEAALGLHDFLIEREEDIEYTPAAGGLSRDPVLEAVPVTPELGEEMWDRVDRITAALEGMDALTDRVTTERLVSLTLDQLGTTTVH